MKRTRRSSFTLLEVIISLAILTVGLAGMLQLLTSSQLRIARAQEKWNNMHMLSQAAEYLMLLDADSQEIPPEFFPFPGYRIDTVWDTAEGLPEEMDQQEGQIPLKKMEIQLIRERDNSLVDRLIIDRFGYDETSE